MLLSINFRARLKVGLPNHRYQSRSVVPTKLQFFSKPYSTKLPPKKWFANGVLHPAVRDQVYHLSLKTSVSTTLIPKIKFGDYIVLYGPRASSKSTHVEEAMEILNKEDYICFKIDFQLLRFTDLESFWDGFGYQIQTQKGIRTPLTTDQQIINALCNKRIFKKKKVVLFIDEFDALLQGDQQFVDSVLSVFRGWKHLDRTRTALHSIVVIGPFNIKHLAGKKISPFNVTIPVPFFPEADFLELFDLFRQDRFRERKIVIDPEIAKDIYIRTAGHPGLTCFCCKMLDERVTSLHVTYRDWLDYAVRNLPAACVDDNMSVRQMVDNLRDDTAKAARDLLRNHFLPVVTPYAFTNAELVKNAEFLAAEGILLQTGKRTYQLLSPLTSVVLLERVMPVDKIPVPKEPVPFIHEDELDIPAIIAIAIRYFDQTAMQSLRKFSHKKASQTRGLSQDCVPHEFVYYNSLVSIFHRWLPEQIAVLPEIMLAEESEQSAAQQGIANSEVDMKTKPARCNICLESAGRKYLLELLATGNLKDIRKHIAQAVLYQEALHATQTWLIHFTCSSDPYLTEIHQDLIDKGLKMMTIQHDQDWTEATIYYSDGRPQIKVKLDSI